ncbi:hypothetical protein MHEL_51340 [Mycolicibacterium helvum]|uniref:Uncharacterized protein n=1 Tax=Mycolicibacterium helvum TaxID=1534349 RepID=A0A7I7TE88_9MYCO|nr:hypothetical protein MHEL_51340 [Mycolicibacterium helvum]
MCTWVAVTVKGVVTFTTGAAVSVDPVTATLPVAPGKVHSGVPAFAGGVVGHVASGPAAWVTEDATAGAVEVLLADGVLVSEPHAVNVRAIDAAQAARATAEGTRGEFTVATLQPHCPTLAYRHPISAN